MLGHRRGTIRVVAANPPSTWVRLLCIGAPVLLGATLTACEEGGDASIEAASQAAAGALVCDLPMVDPPAEPPIASACRDPEAETILGPVRVERHTGGPEEQTFTFDVSGDDDACITVVSAGEDGRHRVAAAWIYVDEQLVADPEAFDQQVTTLERGIAVGPGSHTLSVRVASGPGTYLDITIKAGWQGDRHNAVESEHLEVYNLYADPPVLSAQSQSTELSADGMVVRFAGLPANQEAEWLVRYQFELRRASDCSLVRTLSGEQAIGTPSWFHATAVFDGMDENGEVIGDGVLAYRLVASLIKKTAQREEQIDQVATPQQLMVGDATPPRIEIVLPQPASAWSTTLVPVEIAWEDPEVNGFATGLDLAAAEILLDGVSIAGLLQLDVAGARGDLDLSGKPDGAVLLEVRLRDLASNPAQASTSFLLDTAAPQVAWNAPPDATEELHVPLGLALSDATSGLVIPSIVITANGMDITDAVDCDPSLPDGILASTCSGFYPLDEGEWQLVAAMSDRAGNVGFDVTEVVVDRSSPEIVLDPELAGVVTSSEVVAVIGRVIDALPVSLDVNGQSVVVQGGAFSTQVDLDMGPNTIRLVATDSLGHTRERVVVVNRETDPPTVSGIVVEGGTVMPCVEPGSATIPSATVTTTTSPELHITYEDAVAGVSPSGVVLQVNGRRQACAARATNADLEHEMSCKVDLGITTNDPGATGGGHELTLLVPDRTGDNVRTCVFRVQVVGARIEAGRTEPMAGAAVELPYAALSDSGTGQRITAHLTAAEGAPSPGELLPGTDVLALGQVVQIEATPGFVGNWPDPGQTLSITLPFDPALLAVGDDEIPEEVVRAPLL